MPDGAAADTFRLLTSPGPAAIACVEVRGAGVGRFVERHIRWWGGQGASSAVVAAPSASPVLQAGLVRRAILLDETGERLDDVLFTVHAGPPAPVARIHLHGSPYLVERTAGMLRALGFAEGGGDVPPVFGHLRDEDDAALCALLPTMRTRRGVEWLLAWFAQPASHRGDPAAFERTLKWHQTPLRVAVVGPPNAGKSTLVNALAGAPVSIVSEEAGTTRDWIEAPSELEGYPVVWIDTAGLRDSGDAIEAEGIALTRRVVAAADATVLVLDAMAPAEEVEAFLASHAFLRPSLVVWNKGEAGRAAGGRTPAGVAVSALRRTGLAEMQRALLAALGRSGANGTPSTATT